MPRPARAIQGDLLAMIEAEPRLEPEARKVLISLVARLLLEAAAAEYDADEREASDDEDCA